MKSSFKLTLLAPALFTYLFLIVVHMSSCQSPALRQPPIAILNLHDSSGPQPILHTSVTIPSGTTLLGTTPCKDCKDSSGNAGSTKVVFSVTLNVDIPANTDITLHVESK